MKKIISLLLVLCIVFSLVSCSKKDSDEEENPTVAQGAEVLTLETTKKSKKSKKDKETEKETDKETGEVAQTTSSGFTSTQDLSAASNWNYGYAIATPKTADTSVSWNMLLVNRDYILPENYINSVNLVNVAGSEERLDSRVAQHYEEMFNAAAADGLYLTPCSGYRSYELQKRNFENRIDMYVGQGMTRADATVEASKVILPPGTSEHNAGLAMDIICVLDSFENTTEFAWLMENAQDYGFILRYPKDKQDITKIVYEPWHWRYVGVEAAQAMKKSGECFEEYMSHH